MIHFGTWVWGDKYPHHYIERLQASVDRHYSGTHLFHIWRPQPEDKKLTKVIGCFPRLRTFDPEWQAGQGILRGERIVVLDLDLIITGGLDLIFDRDDDFAILQGINSTNPCPYNGSVWTLKAGYRPDVWSDFSLEAAEKVPWYAFPDDQAWLAHKIPDAGAITPADGVYAFKKPGWPSGTDLPKNAKIVAFPGARDPQQFNWIPWVSQHWRT